MHTSSTNSELSEPQRRWLERERRASAANATFPVDPDGNFRPATYEHESREELAARQAEIIERIKKYGQQQDHEISPEEIRLAGSEFAHADLSALAAAAQSAAGSGSEASDQFIAATAFAMARAYLNDEQYRAALTIAAAPPETVRSTFGTHFEFFHAASPSSLAWRAHHGLTGGALRYPGDRLNSGFTAPAVEPLASRLERATRVNRCKAMTREMLKDLHTRLPCLVHEDLRVQGISIDFLTITWKGIFLIWSIDQRWTAKQAAMVMPARGQIQRELGEAWPGHVEAVFHSPREGTGWDRRVLVDDENNEPVEIVIAGGRIDQLLEDWQPLGQVGIDPEWLRWVSQASEPRWWRSDEGARELPPPPPHDQP
jgi:hypothetical protein